MHNTVQELPPNDNTSILSKGSDQPVRSDSSRSTQIIDELYAKFKRHFHG